MLNGEPLFLKTGITIASFSFEGKTPVEKDKLISSAKMTDISTEIMFKSFTVMLLGPVALLLLKELSIFKISSGDVGLMKIELVWGDLSHSEKWWRDGGIFDRTFEATFEKNSLKVSEINFQSELIELLIWREMSELDLVLSDITSLTPCQTLRRFFLFSLKYTLK